VYYKPGNPGVGTYDVPPTPKVTGMVNFESGIERKLPFEGLSSFDLPIQYGGNGN